jgi:hypothetical protein
LHIIVLQITGAISIVRSLKVKVLGIQGSHHLVLDGYLDKIEIVQEGERLFVLVVWKE